MAFSLVHLSQCLVYSLIIGAKKATSRTVSYLATKSHVEFNVWRYVLWGLAGSVCRWCYPHFSGALSIRRRYRIVLRIVGMTNYLKLTVCTTISSQRAFTRACATIAKHIRSLVRKVGTCHWGQQSLINTYRRNQVIWSRVSSQALLFAICWLLQPLQMINSCQSSVPTFQDDQKLAL